jgi:hypothetical protein
MTFLIALCVSLLGLGCIITGLIYSVGAIWAGVFEGGGPQVTQRLERGLIFLVVGSLLDVYAVIGPGRFATRRFTSRRSWSDTPRSPCH